jgi:methionine salvage enolase-phosphatase E1
MANQVLLSDVDGTIIKEEGGPKELAILQLEATLKATPDFFEQAGIITPGSAAELRAGLEEHGPSMLTNEQYFGRFCSSAAEAQSANSTTQAYIRFEAMKALGKGVAKPAMDLMIAGIVTGKFPIEQYDDAVAAYTELVASDTLRIATYSNGSVPLQQVMLERVPIEGSPGALPNLAELVKDKETGAGMFCAKSKFGKKGDPRSYENAARHFGDQKLTLVAYVTDGIGEAKACAEARAEIYTVLVDRGIDPKTVEGLQQQGITVMQNLTELPVRYQST